MAQLSVVGIGPGGQAYMTSACRESLQAADVIVGYTAYVNLVRPLFPDKNFYETGMTRETERCRTAIEMVKGGKNVCVISSGDSGVYGMASLIYELAEGLPEIKIEIIPGVTAALSGAALLGAPLSNDFAVISLSDLLTPWETVEKRLRAAAAGDFSVCLYNPGSKTRNEHLRAACEILLEALPESRLCGIARNIGREGQTAWLMSLGELQKFRAEMTDTVFIGNSNTRDIRGKLVTPRGYRNE